MHFTLQPSKNMHMFSCNRCFTNHYLPSLRSVLSSFVLFDFFKRESQPTKFSHLPNVIRPVVGERIAPQWEVHLLGSSQFVGQRLKPSKGRRFCKEGREFASLFILYRYILDSFLLLIEVQNYNVVGKKWSPKGPCPNLRKLWICYLTWQRTNKFAESLKVVNSWH